MNMKNASTSRTNNVESPKTPGGISKSLLTPCRRLGLSRSWRKGGHSPFISPLANSNEVKQEKVELRKRKERDFEECSKTPETSTAENDIDNTVISDFNNKNTPCRNIELPRRKKSKSLLSAINNTQATVDPQSPINTADNSNKNVCDLIVTNNIDESTPSRTKYKITKDKTSPKSGKEEQKLDNVEEIPIEEPKVILNDNKQPHEIYKIDRTENKYGVQRPNDLKKECMVVIQKKLFKTGVIHDQMHTNSDKITINNNNMMTQALFDSDSDDIPLNNLTVKPSETSQDSKDGSEIKLYTKKAEDKRSLKPKDASKKLKNPKPMSKPKSIEIKPVDLFDEDDDDFADTKKTILVRKTYAKVSKPSKAKSTGSITQRDIDELKARIEIKKKLLLAKATNEDTKELRDLIKKWQKGCQEALMELMDLMKNKFPDKSNMDYSEILQTLKIPASLVGYDADEDCFNTPDDANIVLASLNDI